jgi:hypothetical protein
MFRSREDLNLENAALSKKNTELANALDAVLDLHEALDTFPSKPFKGDAKKEIDEKRELMEQAIEEVRPFLRKRG